MDSIKGCDKNQLLPRSFFRVLKITTSDSGTWAVTLVAAVKWTTHRNAPECALSDWNAEECRRNAGRA